MAGLPPDDDAAFAGPLGNRRDSRQTAQSGVVASPQGIPSLCEQRGEDDPSHSRQGCEDPHVMLLFLPRSGILCRDEPGTCRKYVKSLRILHLRFAVKKASEFFPEYSYSDFQN
jgi:hypothetical protein